MVLQHHQGFLKFSQSEGMSIFCHYLQEKGHEVGQLKKWFSTGGDLRSQPPREWIWGCREGFFCSKCILFFTELDFFSQQNPIWDTGENIQFQLQESLFSLIQWKWNLGIYV